MKKAIFLGFLFSFIPFNSSCVTEVNFNVKIIGTNCSWEEPIKNAIRGKDYLVVIKPNNGYELYIDELNKCLLVSTINAGDITALLKDDAYNKISSTLTIPSIYISSDITITANAKPINKL